MVVRDLLRTRATIRKKPGWDVCSVPERKLMSNMCLRNTGILVHDKTGTIMTHTDFSRVTTSGDQGEQRMFGRCL